MGSIPPPLSKWCPCLRFFHVHTDVDPCDCTWGLYRRCNSLHWKLMLEEKSLAAPGTQTCQYCAWLFSWTLHQLSYCCVVLFSHLYFTFEILKALAINRSICTCLHFCYKINQNGWFFCSHFFSNCSQYANWNLYFGVYFLLCVVWLISLLLVHWSFKHCLEDRSNWSKHPFWELLHIGMCWKAWRFREKSQVILWANGSILLRMLANTLRI